MNTRPHESPATGDAPATARLEQALRDHHATAVARLSPQVRAQLAQRRNAALRGAGAARPGWNLRPLAAGVAMAGVLALGLQLLPTRDGAAPAEATIAGTAAPAVPNTILDEDPEFYAWLASADVQQLAME